LKAYWEVEVMSDQGVVQSLWLRFKTLRALIFQALEAGHSEVSRDVVEPRRQQRAVAEELVRRGAAKGISFQREGDIRHSYRGLAKLKFLRRLKAPRDYLEPEIVEDKPPPIIIPLKVARFSSKSGEIKSVTPPPPSQVIGLRAIKLESKVAAARGKEVSVLEGTLGKDYDMEVDQTTGIVYYVPIKKE
jgi:hypothetical protein